jgi:chromosome segregation ATPase
MEVELLHKILEKIEHLDQGLNLLQSGMDSLRSEMNEKFDKVEARLDGMDARFDIIEARLDHMDARFDIIEARFDGMDARFDGMEKTMQRLETRQEEDIHSILILINTRLEDTATKADIASLRQDIEFNTRENSLFKLELDRIKRNNYE